MFKINVSKVRRIYGYTEVYDLQENMPVLKLANEEVLFNAPVKVHLTVTNKGRLLVSGTIETVFRLLCSRCLAEVDIPVSTDLELVYCHVSEEPGTKADEADQDDDSCLIYDSDVIDLTEPIMENLILALPMKPVCREECKGLCPGCGRNLNEGDCGCEIKDVDPRLAVLEQWRSRQDS